MMCFGFLFYFCMYLASVFFVSVSVSVSFWSWFFRFVALVCYVLFIFSPSGNVVDVVVFR